MKSSHWHGFLMPCRRRSEWKASNSRMKSAFSRSDWLSGDLQSRAWSLCRSRGVFESFFQRHSKAEKIYGLIFLFKWQREADPRPTLDAAELGIFFAQQAREKRKGKRSLFLEKDWKGLKRIEKVKWKAFRIIYFASLFISFLYFEVIHNACATQARPAGELSPKWGDPLRAAELTAWCGAKPHQLQGSERRRAYHFQLNIKGDEKDQKRLKTD